jgi:predicted RNA polymerase sigma factor
MRQAAQGYGSYTFGGVLGNLLGVAVLISPVIVAGELTSADQAAVRMPVLMVCSAAYGLALAWAGVQFAAREAEGRLPERIKAARIPFRIPDRGDLPARMTAVLEAVYGAYVIDWATTGPQARHLPSEALHLAEVLTMCVPGDADAHGLAALDRPGA